MNWGALAGILFMAGYAAALWVGGWAVYRMKRRRIERMEEDAQDVDRN